MNEARNSNGEDQSRGDDVLEQRARQWFAANIDSLDATSVARLERSRREALALLAQRQQAARRRGTWLIGGALAASVLAAALLLRGTVGQGLPGPAVTQAAYDDAVAPPIEILAADEDAVIAGDAEFYAWVDMDADAVNAGGNGHT